MKRTSIPTKVSLSWFYNRPECPSDDQWIISLNMAFVIDEIWKTRNNLLFQGKHPNIMPSVNLIHQNLSSYTKLMAVERKLAPSYDSWKVAAAPLYMDQS